MSPARVFSVSFSSEDQVEGSLLSYSTLSSWNHIPPDSPRSTSSFVHPSQEICIHQPSSENPMMDVFFDSVLVSSFPAKKAAHETHEGHTLKDDAIYWIPGSDAPPIASDPSSSIGPKTGLLVVGGIDAGTAGGEKEASCAESGNGHQSLHRDKRRRMSIDHLMNPSYGQTPEKEALPLRPPQFSTSSHILNHATSSPKTYALTSITRTTVVERQNPPKNAKEEEYESDGDYRSSPSLYYSDESNSSSDESLFIASPLMIPLCESNRNPSPPVAMNLHFHTSKSESKELVSSRRIAAILNREAASRIQDGLSVGVSSSCPFVPPKSKDDPASLHAGCGIEDNLREKIALWVVNITSKYGGNSRQRERYGISELMDHLAASPETRFHAVQLFSRYIRRTGECIHIEANDLKDKSHNALGLGNDDNTEENVECSFLVLVRKRVLWDIALSCLALSVKIYHDFLLPLHPIHSRAFEVIAPQSIGYTELEAAQKEVMECLEYRLHDSTPDSYFPEIYNVLPSLRRLLRYGDSWSRIKQKAWELAYLAMLDSNFMRFPVSVLTACVLCEALEDVLTIENSESTALDDDKGYKLMGVEWSFVVVVCDEIRIILRVSEEDMQSCKAWISRLRSF